MKLLVLLLAFALVGCSSTPAPTPSRRLGPGERWLPVADWAGGRLLCGGVGFVEEFRLHGSADDPRLVWMTEPDGRRTELAWPVDYSARFTPALELLDDRGRVIAHEGSLVAGGCGTAEGVMSVDFDTPAPQDTADPADRR